MRFRWGPVTASTYAGNAPTYGLGTGTRRRPRVLHHHNPARPPGRDILTPVEHIFTGLLVLVTIAVMWFAGYVVYRLYSDQR